MAVRQDAGLSWLMAVVGPGAAHHRRAHRVAHGAGVHPDAGEDRPRQPDHARAADRHPRRPRLRARARGARAVRDGERGRHGDGPARRKPDGPDVPGRHARHERVERRGHLVRRLPGAERRRRDRHALRVPQLPDADPHGRHDGDLHVRHDPARRGLREPHRRGARHRPVGGGARRPGRRRPRPPGGSSSTTSTSRTPAPRTPCCTTSPSRSSPARRPRSSARRAPARRRSSGSWRACSTSRRDPCASTASTCATYDPDELWERVGLVQQRAFLFSGTDRVEPALRRHDRRPTRSSGARSSSRRRRTSSRRCPSRLEAQIAQGGTNVSGGQRQRLAIARAS